MVLIIDNYDSFTFNLVYLLKKINKEMEVRRNDEIALDEITRNKYSHIIISPGPKRPSDAGIIVDLIKSKSGEIPILGICLGHQAIVEAFGGKIKKLEKPCHGKKSEIDFKKISIFKNLNDNLIAARYHSLIADESNLPSCLEVLATLKENKNIIMALKHKKHKTIGLQFHIESFISSYGEEIMSEFLEKEEVWKI